MNLFADARWSNAEMAEVFGISAQRLGVLCKQGILPLPVDGLHEPKKVVAAYVQHLKRKEEGATQAGESIRKVQLENEMRSMKLKRISGELVPIDRVQKDWFESTRRVRDGFMNLPSRLSGVFAAELSQDKIFELFTKEVHAVLTELSSGQAVQQSMPLLPLEESPPPAQQSESETHHVGPGAIVVFKTHSVGWTPFAGEETDSSTGQADRFSTGD